MSQLNEVLGAIDDFRAELLTAQQSLSTSMISSAASLNLRGLLSQNVHPLENVHATGVGVRRKRGKLLDTEFVIKVYVFDKKPGLAKAALGILAAPFQGVDIDVEELPVMQIRAKAAASPRTTPAQHQARKRPVIGGLQIQPRGSGFVGTLGCFVKSAVPGSSDVFVLSNNHVLVETNRLPLGTEIVQSASNNSADVFAKLSAFETIQLPTTANPNPARNRIDAAIAKVTSSSLVKLRTMFGIANYTPTLKAPVPGMKVTKSGRTTAVTKGGNIDAIRVNGVRVNYGTIANPIIGVFDGTVQITGASGTLFSNSGDSGSAILEQSTGQPVALLFAGLGASTTACDMTAVCTRFNVVPT